jgi:hypothetical protein
MIGLGVAFAFGFGLALCAFAVMLKTMMAASTIVLRYEVSDLMNNL